MKKYLLLLSLLSAIWFCRAQDADTSDLYCETSYFTYLKTIPSFYQIGNIDSIFGILNSWASDCGENEEIARTALLLSIETNTFSDHLFDNNIISYLYDYQRLAANPDGILQELFEDDTTAKQIVRNYLRFTKNLAQKLLTYTDLSSEERFLANFYADPSSALYNDLKLPAFDSTKLQQIYYQPVEGKSALTDFHASFSAGLWFPLQNLSLVGNHFTLGLQLGGKSKKFLYDFAIDFRVGASRDEFETKVSGVNVKANSFLETNFRLDFGYELLQYRRSELDLLGSAGVGVLLVYSDKGDLDDPDDDINKRLVSPVFGFGGSYRFYYAVHQYIALTGRYFVLGYSNKGATSLSGNAFSVTLEWGLGTNRWLYNRNTVLRTVTRNVKGN